LITFGQKLRQIRKEKHLNQTEMAKILEWDFTYLSRLENNVNPPSMETVNNVVNKLNIELPLSDELYALAHKLPPDISEKITIEVINIVREFTEGSDAN